MKKYVGFAVLILINTILYCFVVMGINTLQEFGWIVLVKSLAFSLLVSGVIFFTFRRKIN